MKRSEFLASLFHLETEGVTLPPDTRDKEWGRMMAQIDAMGLPRFAERMAVTLFIDRRVTEREDIHQARLGLYLRALRTEGYFTFDPE